MKTRPESQPHLRPAAALAAMVAIYVAVIGAAWLPAHALELTGVLLNKVPINSPQTGPFWHTSTAPGARPLGFTETGPAGVRIVPLDNGSDGEIEKELLPGNHVYTLLWQFAYGEWPLVMGLNLYFDGDNLTPGISAIIVGGRGFSGFQANSAPTTYSLYVREVENSASLTFDNSQMQARLGAAFYMQSRGFTDWWRPSDFLNLDRVAINRFGPDGQADGVMVFELVVSPSQAPTPPPSGALPRRAPSSAGRVIGPVAPRVGDDQWVVPPTVALRTTAPRRDDNVAETTPTRPVAAAEDSPTSVPTPGPSEGGSRTAVITTTPPLRTPTPATPRSSPSTPGTGTPVRTRERTTPTPRETDKHSR